MNSASLLRGAVWWSLAALGPAQVFAVVAPAAESTTTAPQTQPAALADASRASTQPSATASQSTTQPVESATDDIDPRFKPRPNEHPSVAAARDAIRRGVAFLIADQNRNGSWGGPRGSTFTFGWGVHSHPEAHRSWTVAVTGLAALALLDAPVSEDVDRALHRAFDYLTDNADLKRTSGRAIWSNWGHLYGLQAIASALEDDRFQAPERVSALRAAAKVHVDWLDHWQAHNGGWGYLEDHPQTMQPRNGASFMTAAVIVALDAARDVGVDVPQQMIDRAGRAVARCRMPDDSFTYSVMTIPSRSRSDSINTIKGSLARNPLCWLALHLAGQPLRVGKLDHALRDLLTEGRFLRIALHRPIPHEAYYANSGYFYLFGYYYAALAAERLDDEARAAYLPGIREAVLLTQGSDGAMWDYPMHAYHKPYGTAYGLLALLSTLPTTP